MRFKSEQVLFHLKIYFKHGPGRVVPSTLSCEKLEYTYMAPLHGLYVLNKSSEGIKKMNFQISNLDVRFQINSNGFSRHRSFGHKTFQDKIFENS